jgi:hypothetical protein
MKLEQEQGEWASKKSCLLNELEVLNRSKK